MKSAATRRAEAKSDYDAFLAQCPTQDAINIITSKWVSVILATLVDGSRRYHQLAECIAGVSPKMLTQTLRALEADGLIQRDVSVAVPVRVEYRLTELGQSLMPLILSIKSWAEDHIDLVREARRGVTASETPGTRRKSSPDNPGA